MRHSFLLSLVLVACTRAGDPPAPEQPSQTPVAAPIPKTVPTPKPAATTRVELSSVTLADDCGGTPPVGAPAKTATLINEAPAAKAKSKEKRDSSARMVAKRRCEQTSMQLAIFAGDAASLHVKSVELFDEAGKSLGTLTASKPTRWSSTSTTYEGWDEAFAAGTESNVSYVLSQPQWDHIADRWNKTYTLKTVLSVGGVDQTAQKDVTLTAPTSLPPNVKT